MEHLKIIPHNGVDFYDISPIFREHFSEVVSDVVSMIDNAEIDYVVGLEARGFILGAAVANELGKGFVAIRKKGKLPGSVHTARYEKEYGNDSLQIQDNFDLSGKRVIVIDDILATGGTAMAALNLLHVVNAEVVGLYFLLNIEKEHGVEHIDKFMGSTEVRLRSLAVVTSTLLCKGKYHSIFKE